VLASSPELTLGDNMADEWENLKIALKKKGTYPKKIAFGTGKNVKTITFKTAEEEEKWRKGQKAVNREVRKPDEVAPKKERARYVDTGKRNLSGNRVVKRNEPTKRSKKENDTWIKNLGDVGVNRARAVRLLYNNSDDELKDLLASMKG
jgi:CRISPR/Cas system CSM-associated protein Csm4 (group 5 of RAMP superfamily)